jgi:TetR/AcrR family transcriptional regulator
MEASLEIFAQKGYNGARTKEIAKAAGISETLIFQHFGSKERLYAEALDFLFSHHPVWSELEESIAKRDDRGVLFNLARHMIEHGRKDPRIVRLVIFSGLERLSLPRELHNKPLESGDQRLPIPELVNYLRLRMADGVLKPLDPTVAAKLFIYMVFQTIADHHLRLSGEPLGLSDDEAARTIVDLFLEGIKA